MRNNQTLLELSDISIFYQYLYASPVHKISFPVKLLNATYTLTMDEQMNVLLYNSNFPDLEPSLYNDMLSPKQILCIIDELKKQPSEYTKHNAPELQITVWDEIRFNIAHSITIANERMSDNKRRALV